VTPDLYADTLILTTTIPGDWAHLIKLHQTAQGAILTLSQSTIDFGNVPIASSANATMSVVNSGNLQASISLVVGNTVFGGTPAGLSPVPAGSALNATLSFLPVVIGAQSGSLELQGDAPDVLCAPLPDTVPLTGTGTNGAVALSASSLNFGLVDCGRTANPQLLVLANTGNGSVTWSTTLGKGSSSPFDVTPTGGIVAPGGTALITVTPVAIPATATTSTDGFGDSLAIVTDVVADSPHVIALHQTARGAVLSFAPAAIDFGLVSLNTTASNPFTIINSGNAPAGVTLAVSGLPIFGVTTPGPITIAGNSSVGDTVTFRPSSVAMYSGSVAMSVGASDVVCAPLAAPLQLQGTGSNGRIAVSPTTMDFGQVPCGTTALPRTITITNSSSTDFTWTGSVSNSHFSLSPSNGFVPAGTSVSVSVIPSAIPVFSTTVWDGYAAWVTITTSINGDGQHIVALHESAFGAIPTVSATSLMFGGVQIGTAANSQFSVGNSGNAPFTMVLQNENPVFSFNPQGLTISGGSGAVVSAQFVPTAAVPYIDEASIQATASSFCGPIPAPISLGGTGTVVGIKVSPNSLNFGLVDCGSTGSAQQFTVYNGSMQTVTWTAVLTAGGSFYQASPSGGSLEANATVIVTVTPMPIPSTSPTLNDAFAGIVTITTNLPDDAPHFVSLHQTAQGAILSFTPSSIDFGSVRIGNSRSAGFKVNNDGNLTANYTLSVSNQNDFSVSPNSNVVAGNTFASEVATFHPSGSGGTGSRIGSVTISSPAALCSPLPHPLQMTGEAF
jgi:hypothetical protein